jgi:predicted O-linked N-acetylglucosamine transferase (SPINDLY family)
MPHFCVPPDSTRPIGDASAGRLEVGLPANGFVFMCRAPGHKINPEMFKVWMRLLKATEESVLWFGSIAPVAMNNLRRVRGMPGVERSAATCTDRTP